MRSVIVGGGVAGISAAMDVARRGLGEVIVLSDETHPYYYRPQLTEFLAGNLSLERLIRRPLSWYKERGIDVRLGTRAVRLLPDAKLVILDNGDEIGYDRLLLAMGSAPVVPPLPGADKQGIYTWRTLEDTLAMEKMATMCQDIIVVGGGLLGLELARGLRNFCSNITVLEYSPRLMPRQLDEDGARLLQSFVTSQGINIIVGAQIDSLTGIEHVTGAHLVDGRQFRADSVIVAAGVRPSAALAKDAGIAVDRGIVVDKHMATSSPDVFAAGDVASFGGHSWAIAPIAQAQARIAAANMAGEPLTYAAVVPSTTLKVIGIDVSSVGLVNPENNSCTEVCALDQNAGTYKKIVIQDGTIVGSIVINDRKLAQDLEARIAARASLTADDARAIIS